MTYFETRIESDPLCLVIEWQTAMRPEDDLPHLIGGKLFYADEKSLRLSPHEIQTLLGSDFHPHKIDAWNRQVEIAEEPLG